MIKNNIISNVGSKQISNAGNSLSLTVENNLYWPGPLKLYNISDPNSVICDPMFVNPENNDFHLQSGSSAIDKGVTLADVPTDKDGIIRPQGCCYDIGAYEYVSGYIPPSDTTLPSAITNLSASNITQTSVDLTWTSPGDDGNSGTASLYDIRYSTSSITETNWNSAIQVSGEPTPLVAGITQSMTIVGLSPSTTYYFAIKTFDEVPNISELSNVVIATTLAPANNPPVLAPIGNKTVDEGSTLSFTLSATDIDGDTLTYSAANLPTGAGFDASTKTFFWTPDYEQQGDYSVTFSVSDDKGGEDSETITITVNDIDNQAPSVPQGLTATAISSSQINLSWTASTDNVGVVGYKIYRCQGTGCTPTTQIATSTVTNYSDTGLTASTTYTYTTISAYDAAGNVSAQSSSASAATQTIAEIAGAPVLLYSSAKAGPNHGWEESSSKGAAITIWGKNLGSSRSSNYVTVAGVNLTKDSDYAEWGATTNPQTPKGFQRVTFWLNSSMPEGNTEGISVTVNGVKSNTLPFKIDNTGKIYFLALNGSESNDGKYAINQSGGHGPWKNFGLATSKMKPGDFLYMRGGEWTYIHYTGERTYEYIGYYEPGTDGCRYSEYPINGTDDLRITLTSYPGEVAVFKNVSIRNYSDYWTFTNLKWDGVSGSGVQYIMGSQWSHCENCFDHSEGLEVIGCEFSGGSGPETIEVSNHSISAYGDKFKILANYFNIIPVGNKGTTAYVLYLCSGNERVIADNEISGGSMYNIHAYDEDRVSCPDMGRVMENWVIERNWMNASDVGKGYRSAILLGVGNLAQMRNIVIRNNILYSNGSATMSGIRIFNGDEKNIEICHNTFYGFPDGIGIDYSSTIRADNISIKNNIFSNISNEHIDNDVIVPITLNIERNLYESTPRMDRATDNNPVIGDPQFVNPTSLDFHLRQNSPAIDAGSNVGSIVTRDYDGFSRPRGSGYDIGAYEYISETQPDTTPPASPKGLRVR